jgi:hypothetical protein
MHATSRAERTCLLVRTHAPTPAQVERIGEWHRALKQTEFDLHVSVDVTAAAGVQAVAALGTQIPQSRIHTYTETDMIKQYNASMRHFDDVSRFPGGSGARRVYGERRALGFSLAWGMHVEPICLWAHAVGWRFNHVWVCEDDIGFSGQLATFLRAYSHDAADVVTASRRAARARARAPPRASSRVVAAYTRRARTRSAARRRVRRRRRRRRRRRFRRRPRRRPRRRRLA